MLMVVANRLGSGGTKSSSDRACFLAEHAYLQRETAAAQVVRPNDGQS
jgi:hypothetical protein